MITRVTNTDAALLASKLAETEAQPRLNTPNQHAPPNTQTKALGFGLILDMWPPDRRIVKTTTLPWTAPVALLWQCEVPPATVLRKKC